MSLILRRSHYTVYWGLEVSGCPELKHVGDVDGDWSRIRLDVLPCPGNTWVEVSAFVWDIGRASTHHSLTHPASWSAKPPLADGKAEWGFQNRYGLESICLCTWRSPLPTWRGRSYTSNGSRSRRRTCVPARDDLPAAPSISRSIRATSGRHPPRCVAGTSRSQPDTGWRCLGVFSLVPEWTWRHCTSQSCLASRERSQRLLSVGNHCSCLVREEQKRKRTSQIRELNLSYEGGNRCRGDVSLSWRRLPFSRSARYLSFSASGRLKISLPMANWRFTSSWVKPKPVIYHIFSTHNKVRRHCGTLHRRTQRCEQHPSADLQASACHQEHRIARDPESRDPPTALRYVSLPHSIGLCVHTYVHA